MSESSDLFSLLLFNCIYYTTSPGDRHGKNQKYFVRVLVGIGSPDQDTTKRATQHSARLNAHTHAATAHAIYTMQRASTGAIRRGYES